MAMTRVICILAVNLWVGGSLFAADPSPAGIWLDVPFVKQAQDGCGAASIAMVMQYWQAKQSRPAVPSAEQIQRALFSNTAHGIFASDMVRYFQSNGYSAFQFAGDWADLAQHLEKGRPLIVALKPGSTAPLHYVVVAGLDQEHGLVLMNDPAQRKLLKEDRSRFEQEWTGAGRWTLLALPGSSSH
jgi:predicted double-glycine peptidase